MRLRLSVDACLPPWPRRILIREDDADFADELMQALRACGFVPSLFAGRRPERVFGPLPPDILILDLGAPQPDGFEILRFLRDYERGQEIAIFLVTGMGEAMVLAATRLCAVYRLRLGGVFRKPVGAAALAASLVRA